MSYQPAQSSSSHDQPENAPPNLPAQSPIDWANFMNFQTSPAASQLTGGNGYNGQGGSANPPEQYKAFAQGIAMNPNIQFQHPYPPQPRPTYPPPSPRQQTMQPPPPRLNASTGNPSNGKGKSPNRDPPNPIEEGLTLDPAAFSRDIRFQVPTFLSTQMGGAPAFPPGGEAWSGFSGANFYNDTGNQVLTPGQMFNQMFGDTNTYGSPQNNNHTGDVTWDWSDPNKDARPPGTTFYVNPNPSPNILARAQANARDTAPSPKSRPNPTLHITQPVNQTHTYGATTYQQEGPQSATMPTSALLPQSSATTFPNVASISAPTKSASTINIASSSSAPYAPPSNTAALLTAPVAPPFIGPSLTEGPGLYSTTGFDMVGVLSRVANRKDPKTVLGPVDLSCSFAVVDVRRYDNPIVYASPTFTALTGYDLPQILGRNCRFLQSPDGDVVKGSKRKYTDNVAVAHLKRMLNAGKECQASLINYRRGGIPFINLVTVVPIPWDGTDIVYHVGFQVDLVEQPNAILRNIRDGSYQVNYTVANPPQPPLRPAGRESGISGLGADVLEIMGSKVNAAAFVQGDDGPRQEWLKMVLENCDDFVHVLSLKGLFQYVSPSVRRVLEYDPEDLLNKNISDICHPSDIVPLMRELKDSTHAPVEGAPARPVNLVFRIRRKNSGYVWIECSGRLHVEPGKGRKAVILAGRARSVPSLQWECVGKHGGLAETEFWAKVSLEGLILHATSSVSDVLGQPIEDVVGQSYFSLLPGGDNGPPTTALVQSDPTSPVAQVASAFRTATGETQNGAVAIHHKMICKNGNHLDVLSIFYSLKGRTDPSSDSEIYPGSSSAGLQASSLIVQVKLLPPSAPLAPLSVVGTLTNARPLANGNATNLFEEVETTRGTSWQYELHQLRVTNRRLREHIETAKREGKAGRIKGKKRKAEDGGATLPEQYHAAPRHQLAPGFGFLPPGIASPYL